MCLDCGLDALHCSGHQAILLSWCHQTLAGNNAGQQQPAQRTQASSMPSPIEKPGNAKRSSKWPHYISSMPTPLVCCWILMMCLVAVYSIFSTTVMWDAHRKLSQDLSVTQPHPPGTSIKDTLVMYVFSPTDPGVVQLHCTALFTHIAYC